MTMSESPDDTNNISNTSISSKVPGLKCFDNVTRLRVEQLLRRTEVTNRYNVFDVSNGITLDDKTTLLVGQEESNGCCK